MTRLRLGLAPSSLVHFQLVLLLILESTVNAGELPLRPPLADLLHVHPPLLLRGAHLATVEAVPHWGGDDLVELGGY